MRAGNDTTQGVKQVRKKSASGAIPTGGADGGEASCSTSEFEHRPSSEGRLDFVLQEDFTQSQFLSSFTAHFCYWKHEDVALFVCRAVCGYDVLDGTLLPDSEAASAQRRERQRVTAALCKIPDTVL